MPDEPVFVDATVVGRLRDGVFEQRITHRHIYRLYNAKGIDLGLYRQLEGRCHTWRLIFKDTAEVLSIPFADISKLAILQDTGAGPQYLVDLKHFTQDQPALQSRLI